MSLPVAQQLADAVGRGAQELGDLRGSERVHRVRAYGAGGGPGQPAPVPPGAATADRARGGDARGRRVASPPSLDLDRAGGRRPAEPAAAPTCATTTPAARATETHAGRGDRSVAVAGGCGRRVLRGRRGSRTWRRRCSAPTSPHAGRHRALGVPGPGPLRTASAAPRGAPAAAGALMSRLDVGASTSLEDVAGDRARPRRSGSSSTGCTPPRTPTTSPGGPGAAGYRALVLDRRPAGASATDGGRPRHDFAAAGRPAACANHPPSARTARRSRPRPLWTLRRHRPLRRPVRRCRSS